MSARFHITTSSPYLHNTVNNQIHKFPQMTQVSEGINPNLPVEWRITEIVDH